MSLSVPSTRKFEGARSGLYREYSSTLKFDCRRAQQGQRTRNYADDTPISDFTMCALPAVPTLFSLRISHRPHVALSQIVSI
jgi:hypothetical protein